MPPPEESVLDRAKRRLQEREAGTPAQASDTTTASASALDRAKRVLSERSARAVPPAYPGTSLPPNETLRPSGSLAATVAPGASAAPSMREPTATRMTWDGPATGINPPSTQRPLRPGEPLPSLNSVEPPSVTERRERAQTYAQGANLWMRFTGRPESEFRAKYDPKNDADLEVIRDTIRSAEAARQHQVDKNTPGLGYRLAGAPLRGLLAPLRLFGIDVDPAKGGELLMGGSGEGVEAARRNAGIWEQLAEAGLETGGAALTMGAGGKGLQALRIPIGGRGGQPLGSVSLSPRAANAVSMAAYGGASAPEGERLKSAASLATLGVLGGAFESRIAEYLPKLPGSLRAVAASGGGNALAGLFLGQNAPDEVLSNIVLGTVMRAVDSRPDITEADLRGIALEAVKAQREVNAHVRENVTRQTSEIDQRNAAEREVRRDMPVGFLPAGGEVVETPRTGTEALRVPPESGVTWDTEQGVWTREGQALHAPDEPITQRDMDLYVETLDFQPGAQRERAALPEGGEREQVFDAERVRGQPLADPGPSAEPIVTPEPALPPGYGRALEAMRTAPPGIQGYSAARILSRAALLELTVPELRAEAQVLGVHLKPWMAKPWIVTELVTAAERQALRERNLVPGAKGPPNLTPDEAGLAKLKALDEGKASREEVFSPEREEEAERARTTALRHGATPEEAADAAFEAVAGMPTEYRPDGTIAAGYKPSGEALAEGIIEREAIPAVEELRARDVEPFTSGRTKDGRGFAIGVDRDGQVHRAEVPPIVDVTPESVRRIEDAPTAPETYRLAPEGREGERGAVDLSVIPEGIGTAARRSGAALRDEFGEFIGRVERLPGAAAKETGQRARVAVDETKAARGAMSKELDAAMEASSSPPLTEAGRAATRLGTPARVEGKQWGVNRLYDMIEGHLKPGNAAEARIVETLRRLIDKRGELFEAVGLRQYDPLSDTWHLFKRREDGKIAPRIATPHFLAILERGPTDPLWGRVIEAFSEAAGVAPETVAERFKALGADLVGETPDVATKAVHAEFTRFWKRVPGALFVGRSEVVPLFESTPYGYAKALAERGASRIGVVKAFGQDVEGEVSALRQRFTDETRQPREFTGLMRALSGLAVERPLVDAGTIPGRIVRGVNVALDTAREALLTASAIPNVFEPLGNLRDFAGTAGLGKALRTLAAIPGDGRAGKLAQVEALETLGAITKDVANLSYDRTRPITSTLRALREVSGRVFLHKHLNELQERLAAVVAQDAALRWQAGKGTPKDVGRVMALGYDRATAEHLVAGKGTQHDYDAFIRRAPGQLVGANLSRAEQSRFENRRLSQAAFAFQRYAGMSIRNATHQARTYLSTVRQALTKPDEGLGFRFRGLVRAHAQLGAYLFGKAAQGTGAYLLTALVTGGKTGLGIALSEIEDDPVGFALESMTYAIFSGPYGAVVRTASGKGEVENAIFPVFIGKELWNLGFGTGDYRDKPLSERIGRFVSRVAPVSRAVETGLVAIGLGSPEAHETDTATRAYWRWRFNSGLAPGKVEGGDTTAEQDRFRMAMREAYRAIVNGEEPAKVEKIILRGLEGAEQNHNPAQSILGRRLLTDDAVLDRLGELRSRIGDKALRLLQQHDELLERWAGTMR